MIKKKFLGLISLLFIISFSLYGCANSPVAKSTPLENKSKITQIYAFGDSYSDNGESMEISNKIVNLPKPITGASILPSAPKNKLYWDGHWSNGPTAVEVLATDVNVKLTNYAVGGATSGKYNYYDWINKYEATGVLGQLDWFKKSLAGKKADPNALYFIFASANDYFQHTDFNLPGTIKELSKQTEQNIDTTVKELSGLGAKNFMIVNSTDLSVVPWEVINSKSGEAKEYTTDVNAKLPGDLKNLSTTLNVKITLFDHMAVSKMIRSNSTKYGIKEINKSFERTYPNVVSGKNNPNEYYFWDEWHPTKVVHKIVGDEMAKEIKQ